MEVYLPDPEEWPAILARFLPADEIADEGEDPEK